LNVVVVGGGGGGGEDDDDDDNNDGSDDNGFTAPWNEVLQNLIGHKLVKKFPTFFGTQVLFTEFMSALHLSLS
jgi:hypothetical protein